MFKKADKKANRIQRHHKEFVKKFLEQLKNQDFKCI